MKRRAECREVPLDKRGVYVGLDTLRQLVVTAEAVAGRKATELVIDDDGVSLRIDIDAINLAAYGTPAYSRSCSEERPSSSSK